MPAKSKAVSNTGRSAAKSTKSAKSNPRRGSQNAKSGSSSGGRSVNSKRTASHNVIRKWVEARGGKPAIVDSTRSKGKSKGLLRIDFPGYRGKNELEELSWDEFFQTFDENDLVFLYQEKTAAGRPSRFSKFVSKSTAAARK